MLSRLIYRVTSFNYGVRLYYIIVFIKCIIYKSTYINMDCNFYIMQINQVHIFLNYILTKINFSTLVLNITLIIIYLTIYYYNISYEL